MKVGAIIPQGWTGEYDGWDPVEAWERTVEVAQQAEALGFESIWMFDHFHTIPEPTEEITFESFSSLAALGALTERVRLGHIVICAGFRNPALTAKVISTMDVQTHGRMELGIGAGWKKDEWDAYGYGFPEARERLANLEDQLEVISRMMASPRASYQGDHASIQDAHNVPQPLQRPGVPIMVGGNGPNVTWRLAARFADELNVDGMSPEQLSESIPVIASRCEEIDRDPSTLPVSVHVFAQNAARSGQARVELLEAYKSLGVSRVMTILREAVHSDEVLDSFAADCKTAGVEMA